MLPPPQLLCKAGKGTEAQRAKLLAISLIEIMEPSVVFFFKPMGKNRTFL